MLLNKKTILILVGLLFAGMLTYPASAESGEIAISDDFVSGDYSTTNFGHTENFSQIYITFYNSSYNYISYFDFYPYTATFLHGYESTAFTIVAGGTGGGYAMYDRNYSQIRFVFDSTNRITANTVTLSFTHNIFHNVSSTFAANPLVPSVIYPVVLRTVFDDVTFAGTYKYVTVAARATDTYAVDYPFPGYFRVNINKNADLNSKYFILGSSSVYSQETTFNKMDVVDAMFVYGDGIVLNATLASGAFTKVLVNGSGYAGYEEGDEIIINPETGVGIAFNDAEYAIGDIANISWIRTTSTPFGYQDFVMIKKPGYAVDVVCSIQPDFCEELVTSPPDTGFVKYLVDVPGTYTVSFERQLYLFSGREVLDSDTATVGAESPSYIYAPGTVGVGQLFNVTYMIGWTPSGTVWLRDYYWDNSTNSYSSTYQPWQVSSEKNIEKNVSILVTKTGKHLLKLCDPLLGCKASTNLIAFFNGSEITTNVTFSNITLDKTSYSYGETMLVKVAVDNFNWSSKQVVVEYFDEDEGLIQNQYYVQHQIQSIPLYISDLTFSGSGSALMRLVGRNASGDYVLATASVTLSNIDAEGYGLSVSDEKCKGDIIQIQVIVPTGESGNLSISADNAKYNKDYVINGTKIISYKYQITGTYYITLRVNDNAKRLIIRTVDDCGIVEPGVTYPGMNGTWKSTQDSIVPTCTFWDNCVRGMFSTQGVNDSTRLLFAIFCIVAMMYIGMIASKGNFGVSVILGFLPYAFFSYLSISTPCGQYVPLWVTVFIALIIGIKMRWFT